MTHELVRGETDIFSDPAERDWWNVSAFVKRNCCAPAIYVAILFVGTSLTSFNKPELLQYRNNFGRFQDRKVSHLSRNLYHLGSDKLTVEFRLAILEEHFNNFSQILVQLI